MEKLANYRQIIKRILTDYHELLTRQPVPNVDAFLLFDEQRDHYMIINSGWTKNGRLRSTFVHVRLHNGKFWIEEDWTEEGIATDLLRAGVPREDIVLAFHPPELRPLTEFAAA